MAVMAMMVMTVIMVMSVSMFVMRMSVSSHKTTSKHMSNCSCVLYSIWSASATEKTNVLLGLALLAVTSGYFAVMTSVQLG